MITKNLKTGNSLNDIKSLNLNELPLSFIKKLGSELPPSASADDEVGYSLLISKMLYRFANLADSDALLPPDRELLSDILRYGSAKRVAQLRHCSPCYIGMRVRQALNTLEERLRHWEQLKSELYDPQKRIAELEAELKRQREENASLAARLDRVATAARRQVVCAARRKHLDVEAHCRSHLL